MRALRFLCKETREKKKMSQAEFSKLVGCSQSEICHIERGFIPSQRKLEKIVYLAATESIRMDN